MLRLRGNAPATVDEKGRLKLPTTFKADLEAFATGEGGGGLRHYLTSLDGRGARLYPLAVWEAIEARLALVPGTNPAKRRFLEVTAYYGSEVEPDAQGRFVIPPILREAAEPHRRSGHPRPDGPPGHLEPRRLRAPDERRAAHHRRPGRARGTGDRDRGRP